MRLVFTELYANVSQELGITKSASKDVLNNPDRMQEEKVDDLVLRFYIKKEQLKDTHLLILCQFVNNELRLCLPFRVCSFLFPNIELLEPLMVLQLLAQKFGLVLKIGSRLGKFIYREDIPILKNREIVEIRNPKNHPFLQSVFIKQLRRNNEIIAKCALAFCIDQTYYKTWLSSKPKTLHKKPASISVTRIIPRETFNQIIAVSRKKKDPKDRFDFAELTLSLQLIRKIMGKTWYQRVLRKFKPGQKMTSREYKKLVRSTNVHPLSEALWSGDPKQLLRVTSLGHYLNQLWRPKDTNKLLEKVKELQQYSFVHTYYETKIAAHFDRRGLPVTFIKKKKDIKTPEFRVDSTDGYAFCECKRKVSPSLEIDSLLEDAASQIENYGGPGIVFMEIPNVVNEKAVKIVFSRASELLANRKKVSAFVLTSESFREEFETVVLSGKVWGFFNADSHFLLPEKIKKATLFQDPVEWFPLSQSEVPN